MRNLCTWVTCITLVAAPVGAKPLLRDVAEIDNGILHVALADVIRKNCPTISARMIRAVRFVRGLENHARSLGYSEAEIEAYTDSDAEKRRLRAKAEMFLKANGVESSNSESYCALGRREIQKASRIGSLLKAR